MTAVTAERLRAMIEDELADLIAIRHDLHAHPELCYEETRTAGRVRAELEGAGVEHRTGLAGGTGVLGHLPGSAGQAIGLRADMDALPIEEETGQPYASTHPGRMHACGHDGHTTILIGAARVLARLAREAPLPRPVSFLFQPAEEGGGGGRRMVEDGCLDGSVLGAPIERMFGLHGWPRLPLGVLATRPGPLLAAADTWEITVRGAGGHAAFPHVTRDPVVAGAAIVTAVQSIAARNVDPLDAIVISVTRFRGGTTHNIIPDLVELAGTVRTLQPATRELARLRLGEVAEHVARGHGCEATLDYQVGYPVTFNAPEAVAHFDAVATRTFGAERVLRLERPVMGAEDFSYYGQAVPACFFVLGLDPSPDASMPGLHEPRFDFNDDAIATGVEAFCRLALEKAEN